MQKLHWKPTNQAAAFLLNPGEIYWEGVNEYLAKTSHHAICFGYETVHFLRGLSDAYFAADNSAQKSTTGVLFSFDGGTISWLSRRQHSMTLSTTNL